MADIFAIDENTGALRLAAQLDRESVAEYTLRVSCTDGRYSASPMAEVTVVVSDVNDSPPQFTDDRVNIKVDINVYSMGSI